MEPLIPDRWKAPRLVRGFGPAAVSSELPAGRLDGATPEFRVGDLGKKAGLVLVSGLLYALAIASVGVASRTISPVLLTAMRLVTASAIFGVVIAMTRPRFEWSRRTVGWIVLVALLNIGAPFVLLATSMRYISGSLASVLFNTTPAFAILLAHFALADERLNAPKVIGTVLSVAGATLLLSSNTSGLATPHPQAWIGQAFIVLASLSGAAAVILIRRELRDQNSVVLTAGQVFACALIFVPLAITTGGPAQLASVPIEAWGAMLIAAISAPVLGFALQAYMIKTYSASLGGLSGVATPLFSACIGILFLGEIIVLPIVIGAVLLMAGLFWLNRF